MHAALSYQKRPRLQIAIDELTEAWDSGQSGNTEEK